MGTDDDQRRDDDLRRIARNSSERHRESVAASDVDRALAAVRSTLDSDPGRTDSGRSRMEGSRRRTGWILAAAAAIVALVAGIASWPADESPDRLTSVSPTDDRTDNTDATGGTDNGVDQSQLPTTEPLESGPAATAPTTASTTTVVDLLSVALDSAGNEIASFGLDDGGTPIEPQSTAFTETLLDYLLNRSTILGDTIDEREQAVFTGGLRIHTTLDPVLQQAAEQARIELPQNQTGIDAAIVSIETSTGAVRAIVSGDESIRSEGGINTAITPRPTGSAVETFILAAALQAGAQPDDLIDGRRGCVLPGPWTDPEFGDPPAPYLQINGGVAGSIGPVREMIARSIPCASARLSHTVGLDSVVDTMYRLAESPYLSPGQSSDLRAPIEPVTDLASGVNPMSPLDMASGMQAIANGGVHHLPYFVESVEDAAGNQLYVHELAPTKVLDPDVALDAVDVLRGTITSGTGRRHPLADGRPAIGKTGTSEATTDAWFVGATPQLTTAVWVGDPTASTPMVAIPEFQSVGVPKVQGGLFPAQIWKAFTDAALADEPIQDWDAPSLPERPPVRLVLPGYECVFDASELTPLASDDVAPGTPPDDTGPTSPLPSVAPDALSEDCN